jgi:VWFA-related protein
MRFSTCIPILMVATAIAWPGAVGAAQQPAGEKSAADGSARQVQLAVLMRDKRGAPVANLGAGDLQLTDNGRAQTIQDLSQGSKQPLQLGMLMDTSRGMARAMDSERKAAVKFVDLVLPANAANTESANQTFVIHFDREVELLEDFTGSREKLHNVLEQLAPTPTPENTQGPETTDSDGGYGGQRNTSPQLYDAIYLAANDLMKNRHGRKALVVFGNGVDGGSKESLSEAVDAAERARTPVYTIYFRGDEQRAGGGFPGGRRGGMGGGWPGSGGGWPGGGHPAPGGGGSRMPQADGRKIMEQIATRSGGLYFEAKKVSEFDGIYSQIARDVLGQYLVSYTPDHSSNDTEFHKITVKAGRSDLIVTAPEGYYSIQDESK